MLPAVDVPSLYQGTWRGDDGSFLAINASQVVMSLPNLPQSTCRVIEVQELTRGILVIQAEPGLRLSLARGHDVRLRQLGPLALAADAPLIDAGIAFKGLAAANLRMWGDAALTWLPVGSPTLSASSASASGAPLDPVSDFSLRATTLPPDLRRSLVEAMITQLQIQAYRALVAAGQGQAGALEDADGVLRNLADLHAALARVDGG